jgi:hypothetical protein
MTAKDEPSSHRNAAIIAVHRAHPELTLKEIGARFGMTASGVSLIISGRRGKRRQAHIERFSGDNPDREFIAIRMVIAALEDLDESARERVVQYALARLRDASREIRALNTPKVAADENGC